MSLHASVACNCFERGLLRTPPPGQVAVGEDGFLAPAATDEHSMRCFDEWLRANPCEHPQQAAASVRLGNVAMIGSIRQALESHARLFPILLMRIVYSGSHTGDWLTRSEVQALGLELERLGSGRASLAAELGGDVEEFAISLREVWAVAMRMDKPILF